jgi:Domain of unknown function (DUF4166)
MADAAETTGVARAGLYERLVREAWGGLDEPVRRFHACGREGARAAGTFAVRRGTSRAARLLARLLGLPQGGEAVPLLLSVTPLGGGGERWHRSFAGHDFITEQREHGAGPLLAERAGPFETFFRLTAEGGALAYRSEGVSLRAGRLSLRLPRRLAPRVEARERACEDGGGVQVSVRVTSPLVGLLIEYEGLVRTKEEDTG